MPDVTNATLPLVPTNSGVVLPGMVVSMALETPEARAAVEAGTAGDGRVVLVPRVGGRYAGVGTVAHVEQAGQLPGGVAAVVVRGLSRARIGLGLPGTGTALWVQIEPVEDPPEPSERALELAREVRAVMENVLEHRGASQIAESLRAVTDPGALADLAGYSPDLSFEQKVELLETVEVEARLERILGWMRDVLADLSLRERIRNEVSEGMERTQRDFLLRQQLAAIRKELGEADEATDAIEDYRARLDAMDVAEPVRKAIDREIGRLERTSEQSPEHGWIRTWLDTIFELPWGKRSEDHLDLEEARRTLDADHTGLSDVKERIVEYLAVRKRRADRGLAPAGGRGSGVILALAGPPGVGKTSLGESVARALGRSFARVALGGIRDEAEVRGHRRTYVGAQPGRIVRALAEAGTMNPVFMLDEVDKLGADWRGDPSSALLEVLDPAQNHTFRDHYLEVDLDLSEVLFIATANVADTIPGPLLDRMELIRIDGYTEDEKVAIGHDHLLVRQRERNGLEEGEVDVTDGALRRIASEYTREAGVRSLERELGRLLRKVATRLTAGDLEPPVLVDGEDVASYLGRPRFFFEAPDRTAVPGVATGLAVTGTGGDVLFVEATAMPGEAGLTITGQLGDVMKESAEIALSYVRSHAEALGLAQQALEGRRVHVHVPAGAVPKDGPSAGVTMVTSLVSLLSGRSVRGTVGMTGEVTLQGRVLPIGGVKQKVLAAHRAGLTEVILPARNGPDLDDIPEAVRDQLSFHLVSDVTEVLGHALERAEAPALAEEGAAA